VKGFLFKNVLYVMTVLGVGVGIHTALRWSSISVLHRVDGVFFCFLIVHLWEESRFPGGFTAMITRKLHFTQADPHFGEIVTSDCLRSALVSKCPVPPGGSVAAGDPGAARPSRGHQDE